MNNGTQTHEEIVARETSALPRIVMAARDKEIAWMVMPEVLERVRDFCSKYDLDSDPEILADAIMQDFTRPAEARVFGIWIAIHGGRVIGHLLAIREEYCKKRYINIMQYSLDEKMRIPQGLLQAGFEMIQEWGNLHMATKVRALALNEAHARRLQIFYGFYRKRILMEKEI